MQNSNTSTNSKTAAEPSKNHGYNRKTSESRLEVGMPPPLQQYVKKDEDSDDVDIEFSSDEDNEKNSPATKHIRRIVSDYKSVYHVDKKHNDRSALSGPACQPSNATASVKNNLS